MKKLFSVTCIVLTLSSNTSSAASFLIPWFAYGALGSTALAADDPDIHEITSSTGQRQVVEVAKNDALAFLNGEDKTALMENLIQSFRRQHPKTKISDEAIAGQVVTESNRFLK